MPEMAKAKAKAGVKVRVYYDFRSGTLGVQRARKDGTYGEGRKIESIMLRDVECDIRSEPGIGTAGYLVGYQVTDHKSIPLSGAVAIAWDGARFQRPSEGRAAVVAMARCAVIGPHIIGYKVV